MVAERQGVEIDYCPQCRGVRLDRGELDEIIDRAASFGATSEPAAIQLQTYGSKYRDYRDEDYDRDRRWGKKKRGFLADLFDFDWYDASFRLLEARLRGRAPLPRLPDANRPVAVNPRPRRGRRTEAHNQLGIVPCWSKLREEMQNGMSTVRSAEVERVREASHQSRRPKKRGTVRKLGCWRRRVKPATDQRSN